MGNALTMYVNENHGFYPGHCHRNSGGTIYAIWPVRLRRYLNGNQAVFWCPAQQVAYQWPLTPGAGPVPEAATNEDGQLGYNTGEQLLDVFQVQFCYGYNDWGCGNPQPAAANNQPRGLGGDIAWYPNGPIHEVNSVMIRNSSEITMITHKYSNGLALQHRSRRPTQCPARSTPPGPTRCSPTGMPSGCRNRAWWCSM